MIEKKKCVLEILFVLIVVSFLVCFCASCGDDTSKYKKIEFVQDSMATQIFVGDVVSTSSAKFDIYMSDDTMFSIDGDDPNLSFDSIDTSTVGEHILAVTYGKVVGNKVVCEITINVVNPRVVDILLIQDSLPSIVKKDMLLDSLSIEAKIIYETGFETVVTGSDLQFSELDTTTLGEKKVIVSYGGENAEFDISVEKWIILEMNPTSDFTATYHLGDTVDYSKIKLDVRFDVMQEENDGTQGFVRMILDGDQINISQIDTSILGIQEVSITYVGEEYDIYEPEMKATYTVNILP